MLNARTARAWLTERLGADAVAKHMIAVRCAGRCRAVGTASVAEGIASRGALPVCLVKCTAPSQLWRVCSVLALVCSTNLKAVAEFGLDPEARDAKQAF